MSELSEPLYPYIRENNLEDCQFYHYSKWGGADFLKAYHQTRYLDLKDAPSIPSRLALLSLLKERKQSYSSSVEERDTTFDLKEYLISSLLDGLQGNQMEQDIIGKLIKTFEVKKRLFPFYTLEKRLIPHEDGSYKDLELYELTAVLFSLWYDTSKNLQYLSSLLKMNDILLSLPCNSPFFLYSLQSEVKSIQILEEIQGVSL